MDEVIAEVAIRVQEAEFAHCTSFFLRAWRQKEEPQLYSNHLPSIENLSNWNTSEDNRQNMLKTAKQYKKQSKITYKIL